MEKNMSLYMLPDEILLIIFNYCDTCDLIRLNSVCNRFYNIISEVLNKRSNHLLVTGQMSEKFRERCQPLLSSYTSKFRTNYAWKYGKYEKKLINSPYKLIPMQSLHRAYPEKFWTNILMTKDTIVLGHEFGSEYYLCANDRLKNGSLSDNWIIENCNSDIRGTVLCNDVVVSNHGDNSIREWTIKSLRGRKYFEQKLLRSADNVERDPICSMDVTTKNIITSSLQGILKIWKYTPQEDTIIEENMTLKLNGFHGNCCMFSLAFDFTGTKFAAGYQSQIDSLSCRIYDINNCCTEKYERIDVPFASVYGPYGYEGELLWEDHNTILWREINKIMKIDVRTHKIVCTWSLLDYPEYTDECITCMSSDNLYAIMTGIMGNNGQVILWDQRKSTFIRRYNICDSTIWNLEFDSSHMFTVGSKIYELDFSKSYTRTKSVLSYLKEIVFSLFNV